MAAGVRGHRSEIERAFTFSGDSLRAGLASSADFDGRYVQKQLTHASAETTRRYQRRRDRFQVNLTKTGGFRPLSSPRAGRGFGKHRPTFHPIASEAPRRRHSKVLNWQNLTQMVL